MNINSKAPTILFGLSLIVIGCTAPAETLIKEKSGDPTASLSADAPKPVAFFSSHARIGVGEGLQTKLFKNVPCQIESEWFSLEFRGSAKVNLPSWGPDSPSATMTCIYEGKTYSAPNILTNMSASFRKINTDALLVGLDSKIVAKEGDSYVYYFWVPVD